MIDILMPVKNAELFIEQTIQSILKQTDRDWQLIAIDDHSTDETKSLLLSVASSDSRIKVVTNEGVGIAEALLTGYAHCSGTYVTRMDADDLMSVDKLELLKNKLIESGAGCVAIGKVNYFSEKEIGDGYRKYAAWLNELTEQENNFVDIYKECVIPSPSWMMLHDDLNKIGGIASGVYPEDYDLCFRMYESGLKIRSVQKILHHWRDYPERTSRNDPNYADNRFFKLKLFYFFKLTYDSARDLILYGAGKKAKIIAQEIIANKASFSWLSNNPKKIGHDIYGVKIENSSTAEIKSNSLIIIAVSNPTEQKEIEIKLQKAGLERGEHYFYFS